MTKKQLIELVQKRLNKGSTVPDIYKNAHPLVVQEYISLAFNSIFYAIFKNNPEGLDIYGRWYDDQDVLSVGGRYYCNLPVSTIQMPDNYSSVRRITKTEDEDGISFLPARTVSASVYNRLGTTERSGAITYSVTNKIWFKDFKPDITKVNIFQITPFSDMDDTDPVPVPGGQDSQLINGIMGYFIDDFKPDRKTDNNGY
jgi:hypothetical protein